MKKIVWQMVVIISLGFAANLYANPLETLKKENSDNVIENITSRIVETLPDDIHMRLLAIGPVNGDDGSFVNKLTEQIKAETKYRMIERNDLNKLLEEQGIQLSPISDERNPVSPGRIKGVEGLIMAKFKQKTSYFFFCSLDVFVKMDNVETGDIVFAKTFSAQYLSVKGLGVIACGTAISYPIPVVIASSRSKTSETN